MQGGVFATSNNHSNVQAIPIEDKYALDINEAAKYFGIGEKKLRQIINENLDSGFVLKNGTKYLLKRKKLEHSLDARTSI